MSTGRMTQSHFTFRARGTVTMVCLLKTDHAFHVPRSAPHFTFDSRSFEQAILLLSEMETKQMVSEIRSQ